MIMWVILSVLKLPGCDSADGLENRLDVNDSASETGVGKELCCWCECFLRTGEIPEEEERYIRGTDLSCARGCNDACQLEPRWESGHYAPVDCDILLDAGE